MTGVDLTSWGKELLGEEYSLGFLVKKILNQFKSLLRLRVSSIDPAEIDFELMEVLQVLGYPSGIFYLPFFRTYRLEKFSFATLTPMDVHILAQINYKLSV